MNRYALLTAIVFASSLLVSTAVADTGDELSEDAVDEIDDEDIERAQEAFNQGASLYYEGEYGRAMVEFRRANEILPHPVFAHNIALANHQLGRVERTLEAALEARALDTEGELPPRADATNSALIASIQSVIVATDISEEIGKRTDDPVAVDDSDAQPIDPVPESSWGTKGWGGVGAAAVGFVALTGAAVIDRSIVSGKEELESGNWTGTEDEFDAEVDSLQSRQSTGKLMLFSGIGLMAVGGGLIAWELMSGPEGTEMALSPKLDRPGMEWTLRW